MGYKPLKYKPEPCGTFAEPHTTLKGSAAAKAARGPVRVKGDNCHLLDCDRIEECDEINGDEQLIWVWCDTHLKHEWHSVPLRIVREGGPIAVNRKPVIW